MSVVSNMYDMQQPLVAERNKNVAIFGILTTNLNGWMFIFFAWLSTYIQTHGAKTVKFIRHQLAFSRAMT